MSESLFIRLLSEEDKAGALAEAVDAAREGRAASPAVHAVDPASFQQVPGSPFAYWVSERIRQLFSSLPHCEGNGYIVRVTNGTNDDPRWIRAWWEIHPQEIGRFHGWVHHAKGGTYSPFYADLHLLVGWDEKEQTYPGYQGTEHRPDLRPANLEYFFRPGITWPRRTNGLSFRVLPSESIFGNKSPVIINEADNTKDLIATCAILNSTLFKYLVLLQLARVELAQSYETGLIQQTPLPAERPERLSILAIAAHNINCKLNTINETTHVFHLPATLQTAGDTLAERIDAWQAQLTEAQQKLDQYQREIDDLAFNLYGIEGEDRRAIEESLSSQQTSPDDEDTESDEDKPDDEPPTFDLRPSTFDLLSYITGCVFGRWDARYATGENNPSELPDPFAPLPVCSPGMLTGEDGLPLTETPEDYPLEIDWDGILVDDPNHRDDLMRRLREVLELILGDRAEAIEREAAETLGVKRLRDYFSKSGNGGFWTDHLRRYSKSRRKAPIYWLLQSSKRGYGLWLYYHRLDKDILYKALVNYVEPKIRLEENELEAARSQLTEARSESAADKKPKELEKRIDRQETLLAELQDFRDKLRRAAEFGLEPDLNDGVILNIAPLWEVIPWSEAKKYWQALIEGEYEWSSISRQLRAKGLVK